MWWPDALSSLYFVTSAEAVGHLVREGAEAENIHFVGNPMIDTLIRFCDHSDAHAAESFGIKGQHAIASLHRPANMDDPAVAKELVAGLRLISEKLPVIFPVHPRDREAFASVGLDSAENVVVMGPLSYLEFVSLMADAALVITDSRSNQEESTFPGIPCLTLRDNTERPVTVTMGTDRLVARTRERIHESAMEALSHEPTHQIPPLWDGQARARISAVLLKEVTA